MSDVKRHSERHVDAEYMFMNDTLVSPTTSHRGRSFLLVDYDVTFDLFSIVAFMFLFEVLVLVFNFLVFIAGCI